MKKRSSSELNTARAIAAEWTEARRALFPTWPGFRDWRLALADFRGSMLMAFVDVPGRTVFLRRPWQGPDVAFVHIMCHAVTESESHTDRWYERMLEACQQLRDMGQEMQALMVEQNAAYEVGTPGGSPDLIDWSRPVLEIRMDGEVTLVPYLRQGKAGRRGAA